MPNWRPESASDPDGPDEWRFRPLMEEDRDLAVRLIEVYARRWVERSGYPESRIPEVPDTMELLVAEEWPASSGALRRLRLTSWFTDDTYYLPDWDGDWYDARRWMEQVAELQAGNVDSYRGRYGPTPWDDPESNAWKTPAGSEHFDRSYPTHPGDQGHPRWYVLFGPGIREGEIRGPT